MSSPVIPMECENAASCELTRLIWASHALRVLRAFYCEVGGGRCERRRRSAAGVHVPHDLLPDGRRLSDFGFRSDAA